MTQATITETLAAKHFIGLIGGNINNLNLIAAVVAWMRVEGRAWDATAFARKLLYDSVYHPTTWRPSDPSLIEEVTEANRALQEQADAYKLILAAAARGDKGAGVDFLYALALSSWDAHHFGGTGDSWPSNQLLRALIGITGLNFPPVKQATTKPPPPPYRPKPPDTHIRLLPKYPFLKPYASRDFYAARNQDPIPLPGALYNEPKV